MRESNDNLIIMAQRAKRGVLDMGAGCKGQRENEEMPPTEIVPATSP